MISPNLAHLTRCIAGQIKRNFGSKDILKPVVNKILSANSDATQSNFLLHAVRFLYPHEINKLRGIMKFAKYAKYGCFTGSVISKMGNPVMLGHDDDETRHVSYDRRNSPICELTANTLFALLLVLHWVFYKVYVFLDTNFFSGHATLMWSVA